MCIQYLFHFNSIFNSFNKLSYNKTRLEDSDIRKKWMKTADMFKVHFIDWVSDARTKLYFKKSKSVIIYEKVLNSNFVFRLDDQREDCQTKFGCRIQFMDFAMMKDSDRKVLGDLSQKILENCISEDDMEYFRLQDDTSLMQKTFFDLWGH